MATITAVGGSLAAGALLVWAGTNAFPATRGFAHFRFADYGLLTAVGVLIACLAWPVVTLVSWDPRWLFLRLAVAVTVVLLIPDVYLLARHEPTRAVAVLMVMHLAIALVTYNALVRIAPAGRQSVPRPDSPGGPPTGGASGPVTGRSEAAGTVGDTDRSTTRLAIGLALLVGVEFALGVAVLVTVPTGRPSGWVPSTGRSVYLAHALLSVPLAVGAVVHLARVHDSARITRLSGWIGSSGVVAAGAGGLLAASHPLRLVGFALMLLGSVVAAFGYLLPALDRITDEGAAHGEGPGATRAGR